MKFKITGKPENVSREFVRAWLHASSCVLAYHNRANHSQINVRIYRMPIPDVGSWDEAAKKISLHRDLNAEDMATTILHEVVHAMCGGFGEGTNEKCTSTLVAKLKPTVAAIAKQLEDDTYSRAGHVAHTKMSYRTESGDRYDPAQDRPVGVTDKYYGRRGK